MVKPVAMVMSHTPTSQSQKRYDVWCLLFGGGVPTLFTNNMAVESGSPTTLELVYAWAIKHKQRLLIGAIAIVVVATTAALIAWQKARTREIAEAELSKLRPVITAKGEITPVPASALLQIADNYPKTPAGARARLLAAGALFNEGKFAEAKTQFDKFVREQPKNPFVPDALYGSALCLVSQGKSAEAIPVLQQIINRYSGNPVVPRAKLALAKLLLAQNQTQQAKKLLEDVVRTESGTLTVYEAEIELERLNKAELATAMPVQQQTQHMDQQHASGEKSAN